MGQCVGKSTKKNMTNECYWKEPADTYKYNKANLPIQSYQGSLGNFKIKNCGYSQISIRAELSGVETFKIKKKKIRDDLSASWQFQQKFMFRKTIFEMKKSFLQLFIEDQEEKIVGQLKINLYLISRGPFHQDFALKLKKGENTRIVFDMKISQIIEVQLQSLQTQIDLHTKHPDEKFYFSIKTIIGKNSTLEVNSRNSYKVKVMLQGDEGIREKSLTEISQKKQNQQIIAANKNLSWSNKVCQVMPSIGIKTLVSELHHSYFQILIWKINDKKTGNEKIERPQLFGECFIALQKLFAKDPQEVETQFQERELREIQDKQKIWYQGRQIGEGYFKFKLKNQKYHKQMHILTRTQQGIKAYSPSLFTKQTNKSSKCDQLAQIIKTSEQIQKLTARLEEIQERPSAKSFQIRKIKVQIQVHLQFLFQILMKSEKQLGNCYFYSSKAQLVKAQQVFIQLGFKMTSYLQEEEALISQYCWKILIALLRRGELTLPHLGFDLQEKNDLKSGSRNGSLETKVVIALTYQNFLNKQLQIALKSFLLKGIDIQKKFAQIFLAYAYFRIPQFRNKLFQAIVKDSDPEIPQWRGIQFSLQNDINQKMITQELNTFTVLCDWNNIFYKPIQKQQKALQNKIELDSILENQEWKGVMSERGSDFFFFIIHWVEYIQRIVIKTKQIQWKYFPGYNKIIKSFLIQLKRRPILQYPDALKEACLKLLCNEKLLNSIIAIVLNKGNIYEPLTVLKSIEFINQVFMELNKSNKKIPGSFNYYLLYKAIRIILEGDYSLAISKTLLLIYTHYKLFHLQFRRNIGMLLLGKVFFSLFLHWSYNVRDIFYHVILMRVYRESLNLDITLSNELRGFQQNMNEQIRIRYRELINIIQKAFQMKIDRRREQMKDNYETHLHRALKNKLYEKKKKKRKESLFQKSDKDERQSEQITYQPPYSPICHKNYMKELMQRDIMAKSQTTQFKKVERCQSQVLKSSLKILYQKQSHHENEEIKSLTKNSSDFKHEVYDIRGGKRVPIARSAQIINNYSEQDFQIREMTKEQFQYTQTAFHGFKKVRDLLQNHSNDKNWSIPSIKMEMRLDIRESRPEKIDNY